MHSQCRADYSERARVNGLERLLGCCVEMRMIVESDIVGDLEMRWAVQPPQSLVTSCIIPGMHLPLLLDIRHD